MLIGRERDLARIESALDTPSRPITLLGPPGIGKTRLARELAERHRGRFCALADVTSRAELEHVVLRACEVDDPASLAETDVGLLVLDNFEQLLPDGARTIEEFSAAAPSMRMLVTSRERLATTREWVIEVEPLSDAHAVELFRARAAAISGTCGDDVDLLAELVDRLDKNPLAIELAAAQTRLFSPKELLRRLADRFALLVDRRRGTDPRHATLENAIGWTWNLLESDEQRALADCSVFAGSFTAPDFEAIATAGVDILAALRDKSLLFAAGGPDRFALYVSVREYAAAKLEAMGEWESTSWRHARHYAARARQFAVARSTLGTESDIALRGQLTSDRENLMAALAFTRSVPESAAFADLAVAVTLLQAASAEECKDALDVAIASQTDGELSARLLLARHSVLAARGRFDDAERDMRSVLAAVNLPAEVRAFAHATRGARLRTEGRSKEAWEDHLAAEAILNTVDRPRLRAMNLACMGRLQCDFGDVDGGRSYNGRAHALAAQIGDTWLEALVLGNLAQLEQERGHFQRAEDHLRDALRLLGEASEPQYVAVYSIIRGDLCFERGDIEGARANYAAATGFFNAWRGLHRMSVALHAASGALEARHGELALAESHFSRARHDAARSGTRLASLTVEIHEGALHLRRAHDDAERLAHEQRRLRTWVHELSAPGDDEDQRTVQSSIDVRFALRMLQRALEVDSPTTLAIRDGGFSVNGGPPVSLARRGSLRRILLALAESAGQPLDADTLIARGWPNERTLHEAGRTRLRVAITTLRKLGLRDVLLTRDDGYMVDPRVRVERIP